MIGSDRKARMDRREFTLTGAAALAAFAVGRYPQDDWKAWRVNGTRVNQLLQDLSQFGKNPQGGVTRVGFGPADIEAHQWAAGRLRDAGLTVRVDAAGNLLGRREGTEAGLRPILFGSHIDSVLEGGNYDGDVGSMGAIEVAHTLADRTYRNRHPLDVVIWCDEESGLTGSRAFIGEITAAELARPGLDGVTLAEKIRGLGGKPDQIAEARHEKGGIAAYVELHIEQGGTLDREGIQIGLVEGIVGIRSFEVTITGFANHAGTTPMNQRKNALLPASEIVLAVDRLVRSVPGRQVGTVGRMVVKPGAQNVVPGEVAFTIELRDLSMEKIESVWKLIRPEAEQIAARYETTLVIVERPTNVAALSDPKIRGVVGAAAAALGLTTKLLPSGAGHDAQDISRIAPMAMIFVPSVGGISHSPKEFTRPGDVTNGANVLLQTILRLDQGS